MQDIADACCLSRNTVSKIFNGRGSVPESTRRMVMEKARELGYSQFPQRGKNEAPDHWAEELFQTRIQLIFRRFRISLSPGNMKY